MVKLFSIVQVMLVSCLGKTNLKNIFGSLVNVKLKKNMHLIWKRTLPQTNLRQTQLIKRLIHEVRVRFAPSPTGHLHLGGLRTALYNYLFARHHKGKFLLRIEDTDRTRLVSGAVESLIEDLLWSGIEIDEGPGFYGTYGPYVQSERTDIYKSALQTLLNNGTAYHCFCTERRLELLRKEAMRTRQVPRYDNKCRHLTKVQVDELLAKGTPHCIRFKLIAHTEPFQDIIYGPVQHNVADSEGDPVIMKSDNFPTYHFANVVDDHFMNITHVLRGVEWQISTTKHLLLYKAFGWKPPQFGHLPLLVNPDGTKLSKRQGDIGIKHFRNKGYFSEALLNYVVSAGGGFPHKDMAKPQIYSVGELSEKFDIGTVNSHASRLNPELLDQFNRMEISKLLENKDTTGPLVKQVQTLIQQAFPAETNLDLATTHIEQVLRWSTKRLTFLQDLTSKQLSFLWVRPIEFELQHITIAQIQTLMQLLQEADFSRENVNSIIKQFAQQEQLKFPVLMKTLRSALSGLKEGPSVAEMMEILGRTVVLQRLEDIIKNLAIINTKKTSDAIK